MSEATPHDSGADPPSTDSSERTPGSPGQRSGSGLLKPAGLSAERLADASTAATLAAEDAAPTRCDASILPVVDPASYRVVGQVAQGGIGRILRAWDERLARAVALKELLPDAGSGAEERFVREALVTARLQHPSIVPLYEAGRWPNGAPFYAMKLVSGRSLADVIEEGQTLDQRLALLPHVLAVAEAMAYAHSERIIHRDLKPANVIVGAFGETVVIDWGLAKDLSRRERALRDSLDAIEGPPSTGGPPRKKKRGISSGPTGGLTISGSVMGTPAYMPLEQASGERVDERSDVYALGAILYHLLAGVCPYDGDTAVGILRQVLATAPVPLEQRQRGIPADLSTIVKKAMARDPADRYPSAKELADDLRRFQTGQIVGAHKYSTVALIRRFTRRYRAPLAVAAAAVAVLAGTGAIGVQRVITERDRAEVQQADAEEAQRTAVAHADDLTLVQARASIERDPNKALAWLRSLSPSFSRWPEARLIAATARDRGISTELRGHSAAIAWGSLSPDGETLATTSDDHTIRLWDVATGESRVLFGHTDEVWYSAFSPSGDVLATSSKDKTIRLWDMKGISKVSQDPGAPLESGAIRSLTGLEEPVHQLLFSGEDLLVFGSFDSTVRVWDTRTGERRGVIARDVEARSLSLSPDGQTVALAGSDWTLRLVDVRSGASRILGRGEDRILRTAFSPDGQSVATEHVNGRVQWWTLADGSSKVLAERFTGLPQRFYAANGVQVSPDGRTLASGQDGLGLRVWDPENGTGRRLLGHEGRITVIAFSPDSQLLASGSYDHTVRIWDLARGEGRALYGFDDVVSSVAFSRDGRILAATSSDGTARLFQVTTDSSQVLTDPPALLETVDFSPDGRRVVVASQDGAVRLWDVVSGGLTRLEGHTGPVHDAVFSPDGELVAATGADRTVRLWDRSGRAMGVFDGDDGTASVVAFSPDSRLVAAPGRGASARLWDIESGASRVLEGHEAGVVAVAFSPDGKHLATASSDRTARLWDVESGASRILRGHTLRLLSAAFSPDSTILATGSDDHTLRFWEVATGVCRTIDAGGSGITQIVFSPDARFAITAGAQETSARIWDVATGAAQGFLRGHEGVITRFSLSPDGGRLLTASADKTVRLWDLASGEGRILRGHTDAVLDVAFSPDGKRIVSTGADGTVRLWSDDLPDDPASLRSWIAGPSPAAAQRLGPDD